MSTPNIFVSHSHLDNRVCRQIVVDLRQSFPDAHIFYDESELHAGDEWQERIQREVIDAPIFIVILSPQSVVARWVRTETNLALNLAMEDPARKVIPLRIDASVEKAAIMHFVPILILRQIIDMTDAVDGHTPQRWPELLRVIRGESSDVATQPQVPPAEAQRLQSARDLARQIHEAVAQQQWLLAITLGQSAILAPGNEQDDALFAEYAQALLAEGDTAAALAMIERALAVNSIRPDYWRLKAQCLRQAANADPHAQEAALAAYQQAFIHAANTTFRLSILVEQFDLELTLRRWDAAQRTARLAMQLAPNDAAWPQRQQQVQTEMQRVQQDADEKERQAEIERQRLAEIERQRQAAAEEQVRLVKPLPVSLQKLHFTVKRIDTIDVINPPISAVIPAGPFTMGGDKGAYNGGLTEKPAISLNLGAFQIGLYPVTVAEYACAVAAGAVAPHDQGSVTWAKQREHPDHPVVCVTWLQARDYTRWLTQMTGQPWRLPTEAEWERAARGTDGRIYPWGKTFDKNKANIADGSQGMTSPVGYNATKGDASPCGAHDMAGNVREWTSSIWQEQYDPVKCENDRDETRNRTLRGGSWGSDPRSARAASRNRDWPDLCSGFGGWRLALGAGGAGS